MKSTEERLAALLEALERLGTEDTSPERQEAVLRKRAALAAAAREEVRDPQARLLVFRAAGETWAIDLSAVSAISIIRSMTPLPGVPRALAGLLNVRGRNVTAVDLGLLLGARSSAGRRIVDAGKAITLAHAGREIALIAEDLVGIQEVFAGEVEMLAGTSPSDPVRALAPGGAHVIDPAALFMDPRLGTRAIRGAR